LTPIDAPQGLVGVDLASGLSGLSGSSGASGVLA